MVTRNRRNTNTNQWKTHTQTSDVPAEHPLVAHVLDVDGVHNLGTLHLDHLVTPVGLHARNLHFDQLLLDCWTNTGGVGKALKLSI